MASLTQTAIIGRKAVRYLIYAVVLFIVGRFVLGLGVGIFQRLFPKPPPAPTIAFGRLPKITFPVKEGLPTINYTLETVTGDFPKLADQLPVYHVIKNPSSLLSLDKAKEKAIALGFTQEPQAVSQTVYKFNHPSLPSSLEMNIVTGLFSISYDLARDPTPLASSPTPPEKAISDVKSFLQTAGLLTEDLATGKATTEFLKIQNKQLLPAISLSEANLVKVNLFRKDYNEVESLSPSSTQANVWFLVSGATDRDKKVLSGEYHYLPLDEAQSSTYPLKTADVAWEELKQGKGYIANLGLNTDAKVIVRRIYLAYYDPNSYQDFYQPIIVFEGDRGFMAYVPAVIATYYQE